MAEVASLDTSTSDAGALPPTGKPMDIMGMYQGAQDRADRNEAERRATMAPLISSTRESIRQPIPAVPDLQSVPQPPQDSKQFAQESNEFLRTAMIAGSIMGAIGRKHITNGLTAFAGAVEGFHQGQQDRFKQGMEQWRAETEAATTNNKQMLDRYNAIMKNRSMDIDQKMNEMQLVGTEFQNRAVYDAASVKHVTELARYMQTLEHHNAQLKHWAAQESLSSRALDIKENAAEAGRESDEALLARVNLRLEGDRSQDSRWGAGQVGRDNKARYDQMLVDERKRRGMTEVDQVKKDQQYIGATAGARSVGIRASQLELIGKVTEKFIPDALATAGQLDRTGWKPVNKLIVQGKVVATDPVEKQMAFNTLTLAENWARAINPSGTLHATLVDKALDIMGTATNYREFKAGTDQLMKFLQREKESIDEIRGTSSPATKTERTYNPATGKLE